MVYSPLDALRIARANPERKVVFLAVGFETTAPGKRHGGLSGASRGSGQFLSTGVACAGSTAIRALSASDDNRVQGFIAPGHVCAIVGCAEYEDLVREFDLPIVVGGFEPVDLLQAILALVTMLESGKPGFENQYTRSVSYRGNIEAQRILSEVFEVADQSWRGLGEIPMSGLRLRERFAAWDAERVFSFSTGTVDAESACISADILKGLKKPTDCVAFGCACTPQNPLGAPMVSSEGACSAYYQYRRHALVTLP